jgi:hypothetical protein
MHCNPHRYYEDGLFCDPQYKFGLTAFYFIVFILVGALVLFTLFIGVVSMSFDEAQTEQKAEAAVNVRVLKFADQHDIGPDQLALYREVFALVDFTGSSEIGKQELKFGLKLAEMDITEAQVSAVQCSTVQCSSRADTPPRVVCIINAAPLHTHPLTLTLNPSYMFCCP